MVEDLLPVSTEAPRCSEFARDIDVLPPGSGLFLARVILVSVPLPWPKPALKHPLIERAASHVMASSIPSRLFAAEPLGLDQTTTNTVIEVFERHQGVTHSYRWVATSATVIDELVAAVAASELGALQAVSVPGATAQDTIAASPTFLVCTQGSHDMCCGTSGVALADQIERERPGYAVRRVSHTGGHRFSPTLLHFPEGRMWAFVDLDLVDRIADGTTTAQDHRSHGRGWWGAKVGPAQVAETAVRAELADTESLDASIIEPVIEALDASEGRPATTFGVTVGQAAWRVHVSVGRQIPTIACEAPGGLPVKPGREFAWTIERV